MGIEGLVGLMFRAGGSMRAHHLLIALLTVLAPRPLEAQDRRVYGRVLDHDNRDVVVGATVRFGGTILVTDQRGGFTTPPLPAGEYVVRVEMLGYATRTDTVRVAGLSYDLEIRLSKKPIDLPPIQVQARSDWLHRNGFYERTGVESGLSPHVVTAVDIERRGWSQMTDVFQRMPGVEVRFMAGQRRLVRVKKEVGDQRTSALGPRRLPGCEPALYIDGNRYRGGISAFGSSVGVDVDDWNILAALVIEAVEVYTRVVPVQYNNSCGVVLVWTKR